MLDLRNKSQERPFLMEMEDIALQKTRVAISEKKPSSYTSKRLCQSQSVTSKLVLKKFELISPLALNQFENQLAVGMSKSFTSFSTTLLWHQAAYSSQNPKQISSGSWIWTNFCISEREKICQKHENQLSNVYSCCEEPAIFSRDQTF